MWRTLKALFTVAIAALLSVLLAIPAQAADDPFWSTYQPKPGGAYQYKYGYDYYKQEWKATPGAPNMFTNTGAQTKQPVAGSIDPSRPSSTVSIAPENVPLEGKIIEPGKTLMRAPSTYMGLLKGGLLLGSDLILGTAGVGMGGTSAAPSNWKDLALAQGVPQTCVDTLQGCGSGDMSKITAITGCGQKGTCASIGAVGGDGNDFTKWFQNETLPFLDDIWGQLTGQKQDTTTANGAMSDSQIDVTTRGCIKEIGFEPRAGNNATLHGRFALDPKYVQHSRPPTSGTSQTYWDTACGGTAPMWQTSPGTFAATCANVSDGKINTHGTQNSTDAYQWNADGTNKYGMCGTYGPATDVLVKVRFWNPWTQTQFDNSPSSYGALIYSEWINPDPKVNTIEDTKITSSWSCRDTAGTVNTYTVAVSRTAGFASPDCPLGSDLISNNVKETTAGGNSHTLTSGGEVPGTNTKYPACSGVGCTMDVYLDGTKCAATNTACSNWPAIAASTPSRIQCKWGTYVMPTSDCNSLSNAYKTESGVVFDPKSGTWVAIDPYGNPVAPNPQPWSSTNPTPIAGAAPGTAPATATAGSAFPTTGTSPSDGCDSPTWSWNPVDFVKSPVVCALKDAFVPKTDWSPRMNALSSAVTTHPPMSWLNPPAMIGPGGGGCPNWVIKVDGLSKNVVCDSSFTAAIIGSRGAMFGLVSTAMVFPLLRSIWYAAIPVLRVTPSK